MDILDDFQLVLFLYWSRKKVEDKDRVFTGKLPVLKHNILNFSGLTKTKRISF